MGGDGTVMLDPGGEGFAGGEVKLRYPNHKCKAIVTVSDCVFTGILGKDGQSLSNEIGLNSMQTIGPGIIIRPLNGAEIYEVQMQSGLAIGILLK